MGEDHEMNGPAWKGKKPVLIIEDLDRLDPKHLFRILNVISAHMEDGNTPDKVGNKFGFHSIVLVMDYDVTKHIFHHFYGDGACYEGYMSKFLSREPFRYSIQHEMVMRVGAKLARVFGLSHVLPLFETFKNKLLQSSIRDLSKLALLDTNHYLKSSKCVIKNPRAKKTITLSTSFPIFHLLVYMIESGMTKEEIKQTFIDTEKSPLLEGQTTLIEYLTLVYPIYRKFYQDLQRIMVTNKVFSFNVENTKRTETSVTVKPIMTHNHFGVPTLLGNDIGNVILDFLDKISPSINLSALHAGNN